MKILIGIRENLDTDLAEGRLPPVSKKATANNARCDHLKLAKASRVRLFDIDAKLIKQEARRTGQTTVSLIRTAVSLGLPELLAKP